MFNHLYIKQHNLILHSIIEEKKQKYYWDICDTIFFFIYMNQHMKGKKHNNTIEINNL
jgi:hypothetical protein